jgi:hypothetical protein
MSLNQPSEVADNSRVILCLPNIQVNYLGPFTAGWKTVFLLQDCR